MAWLLRTPSPNPVNVLLSVEGTSLVSILGDQGFPQALRAPNFQLCEFLTREDRVDELFDWVLTDTYDNAEDAPKIISQAADTLASPAFMLQGSFMQQPRFLERMKAFPSSKYASLSRFCGYFCRIVESYARFTRGKILRDIPELRTFMTEKRCLAVTHMFVELASIFHEDMQVNEQTFVDIAAAIRSEDGALAMLAIRECLEKVTLVPLMATPGCIGKLLEIAVDPETEPIVACDCFYAVDFLLRRTTDKQAREKVNECEQAYEFKEDCRLVFATQLFNRRAVDLIDVMFRRPPHTLVNGNILQSFCCLTNDEQVRLVNEKDLTHKVMACMRESCANGHVLKLAEHLAKLPSEKQTGLLAEEDWKEFVTTVLARALLLDQSIVVSQGVSAEQLASFDCTDPQGIFDDSSSDDGVCVDDEVVRLDI